MTIPTDIEAQILRFYHVEKWRVGTIAQQLCIHPDTVARVLAQAGLPRPGKPDRPSKIDPYLPFIHETLAKSAWQHRGLRDGTDRHRDSFYAMATVILIGLVMLIVTMVIIQP